MTEKLYDLNSYLTAFDCKVISLYKLEGKLAVELDRTAFFPEGGGQTSDVGWLGDVDVENVEIRDGRILHFVENCKENVKKLQKNTILSGKIDWKKRFSDMQQHSGEHILSGVVHRLYGYNNVGFHLSASGVTVDFDGELTETDIRKVECLVNRTIWENREVRVSYPNAQTLLTLPYRSKKEIDGPVRIVEIDGVDLCACCAPHVAHTGEIGLLRVVSAIRNRGGTRLSILCGERALLDATKKLGENERISRLLSCRQTETAQFVQTLKAEKEALAYRLVGLERQLLQLRAQTIAPAARIVEFVDGDAQTLRWYADLLAARMDEFAAVFSTGDVRQFVIISKTGADLDAVCQTLRSRFSAKGGGRGGVLQGSVAATEETLRVTLLEEVRP